MSRYDGLVGLFAVFCFEHAAVAARENATPPRLALSASAGFICHGWLYLPLLAVLLYAAVAAWRVGMLADDTLDKLLPSLMVLCLSNFAVYAVNVALRLITAFHRRFNAENLHRPPLRRFCAARLRFNLPALGCWHWPDGCCFTVFGWQNNCRNS
ncbi:hypothetical protein [Neisseria perflava]|uniref:hypothetical protein n=1 Tax=Neisseria perflava TaxID=33053 RepID=UPI00209EAF17|nr:hypothetical protein [Neisseria perflava]MCP1660329.1 hypothetical protein [Neisseria perflava]MCP1771508.1 hypothetical protein [Neisseria perflava]